MDIRFFKVAEINRLQEGINDIWAKNHIFVKEKELLTYMFHENPAKSIFTNNEHFSFLGAWERESLIGILGILPFHLNVFGKKSIGCTLVNWAVLPEHRNSGAGLALINEVKKYHPTMILSLGINPKVEKLYKLLGWNVLDETPRWIGIVNKKKTIELMLKGDHQPLRYWNELKRVQANRSYKVIEVNELDERKWDTFYWGKFAKQSVGFTRDSSFLSWRYFKHPFFTYHTFVCMDQNGDYKGLVVVRIETILTGEKIGRIVEFISSDQDSAITLANALIGMKEQLLFFDFFCFSNISTWGLEAVGFKRVLKSDTDKQVVPMRFQPLDFNHTSLMAAIYVEPKLIMEFPIQKNDLWYVTKGDSDQDRPN